MAEILAIPASAVALVQAIELAGDLIARLYGSRKASAEANRAGEELRKLHALVRQVEEYAQGNEHARSNEAENVLRAQISSLKAELDAFVALVQPHLSQGTAWARLKTRTKWVMGLEKKLSEMPNRLLTHGHRLQLAFHLYSGYESRVSSNQMRQRLDRLSPVPARGDDTPTIMKRSEVGPRTLTTLRSGSILAVCGRVLNGVTPAVYSLVMGNGSPAAFSIAQGQWFLSHLHGTLHEIFSGRIHNSDSISPVIQPQFPRNETKRPEDTDTELASLPTIPGVMNTSHPALKTDALVNSISADIQNDRHHVHFTLFDYQPRTKGGGVQSLTQCRLHVQSGADAEPAGSVLQILEVGLIEENPRIWRSLSSFGVHPRDSPVFEHIQKGNVPALQRMLSLRLVSPNDRDEDGNSLLWHSLRGQSNTSYEMCQLLLQEKADPSDCNRAGDHAMAVLAMNLTLPNHQPPISTTNIIKTMNLLLHNSTITTADITGTLQYKRRKGVIDRAPASLLHCTIPRRQQPQQHIHTLHHVFRWLVTNQCKEINNNGLERTDKNGNTPLLYTLFYTDPAHVSAKANVLLDAGADPQAMNNYGENALHLLCRRLGSCAAVNISGGKSRDEIVKLMTRLIREGGLDPVKGNRVGFTPIDAAMSSPAVFAVLCEALRECGRRMREEVRLLDAVVGVRSLSECEVEGKVAEVLKIGRVPVVTKDVVTFIGGGEKRRERGGSDAACCYLCGEMRETLLRPAPFDEFYTRVVDELGEGIHTVLYKHPCMSECLEVSEEDSCFTLDYHPVDMSRERLKERSWRRHVAAVLEERGLLGCV